MTHTFSKEQALGIIESDSRRCGTLQEIPLGKVAKKVVAAFKFRGEKFPGFEVRLVLTNPGSDLVKPTVYHPTLSPTLWKEADTELRKIFGVL